MTRYEPAVTPEPGHVYRYVPGFGQPECNILVREVEVYATFWRVRGVKVSNGYAVTDSPAEAWGRIDKFSAAFTYFGRPYFQRDVTASNQCLVTAAEHPRA
ncbi:MAG: hypothetical protein ACRDRJ_05755 [Streptosporangiaceae bacterium]